MEVFNRGTPKSSIFMFGFSMTGVSNCSETNCKLLHFEDFQRDDHISCHQKGWTNPWSVSMLKMFILLPWFIAFQKAWFKLCSDLFLSQALNFKNDKPCVGPSLWTPSSPFPALAMAHRRKTNAFGTGGPQKGSDLAALLGDLRELIDL